MATSSIYQTILVKDKRGISRLISALEESRSSKVKDVAYSRPVEIIDDPESIQKLFGDNQNDGIQDSHNR